MNKKTITMILLLVLILFVLSTGCSSVSLSPETVEDDLGREITLAGPPERIISLMPGKTEKLFALGLGDRVIGITDFCNYPPELKEKNIARLGDAFNLSLETIIALEPDLVVANWLPEGMGDQLAALGIPVFLTAPAGVEETLESILRLGKLTGRQREAEKMVADLRKSIAEIAESALNIDPPDRQTVLCLLDEALFVAGQDTLQDELITLAGGINVVEQSGWVELSEESLLLLNPDVLLYTFPDAERLFSRPEWRGLSCIKQGKIFKLDEDLSSRTGPRLAEAVNEISDLLYPEKR